MNKKTRTGVLLLNLGTPDEPTTLAVGRYLQQFLMDPLVIDLPLPLRWLLVRGLIIPARTARATAAYKSIWNRGESPLRQHLVELGSRLQQYFRNSSGDTHPTYQVEWAMRYGQPGIGPALQTLKAMDVTELRVLPLYPQYALSSTQSSREEVRRQLGLLKFKVPVLFLNDFYNRREFIQPVAEAIDRCRAEFKPDHVLLSFHGLPTRHLRKAAPTSFECTRRQECCVSVRADNLRCYRAQSFATARLLAQNLSLTSSQYSVGFQSRLRGDKWIQPYSDQLMKDLARQGVKRLLVACPSFVADCLETLEEIGLRGRHDFCAAGGEDLRLVPSLNSHPDWVKGVAHLIEDSSPVWTSLEY